MYNKIKSLIKNNLLLKLILFYPYKFFKPDKPIINPINWSDWNTRIHLAKVCPDNKKIHKIENAGKIIEGKLLMHNGLVINPTSYGNDHIKIFLNNKSVHEPQEEYIFQEVLKKLPFNPVMVELGSYWAFYSMWFLKKTTKGKAIMVEPNSKYFKNGIENFKINNLQGEFIHSYISSEEYTSGNDKYVSVDSIVAKYNLHKIDILHSDIQGYELNMLKGSIKTIKSRKIGYYFISTHSNRLHYDCIRFLKKYGFKIIVSADLNESYSIDGLIVAKHKSYPGLESFEISKRNPNDILKIPEYS